MGELVFIGLGLQDDFGISLRGFSEVKDADVVFMERYTSLLPGFMLDRFERAIGKRVNLLSRSALEDENAQVLFDAARNHRIVLLVPGDPMIATTHVSLRIDAEKRGIKTRIVHGASVVSAVIGSCGLQSYKFGKTVTIPFPEQTPASTPYEVILDNKRRNLHTLCLLDINVEGNQFLTVHDALVELLRVEAIKKKRVVTKDTLVVGVARAGSDDTVVKADSVREILDYDFGAPPVSLIFPGELHFTEAEALIVFAGANQTLRNSCDKR